MQPKSPISQKGGRHMLKLDPTFSTLSARGRARHRHERPAQLGSHRCRTTVDIACFGRNGPGRGWPHGTAAVGRFRHRPRRAQGRRGAHDERGSGANRRGGGQDQRRRLGRRPARAPGRHGSLFQAGGGRSRSPGARARARGGARQGRRARAARRRGRGRGGRACAVPRPPCARRCRASREGRARVPPTPWPQGARP